MGFRVRLLWGRYYWAVLVWEAQAVTQCSKDGFTTGIFRGIKGKFQGIPD
jgi:hypothetical protein